MTVVAVLVDPPRPGLVLPELVDSSPLSTAEAADCYAAMVKDAVTAVERSGGELLVNYRPDDLLPEEQVTDTTAEAEVRSLVADAVADVSEVRFEPQVGSTPSARAGNTITHLLREEESRSAAVVRGNAPFLSRKVVDNAAMKLRRSAVVLGPATEGRVYFAGFTEPVDFEDAFEPPALGRLTDSGRGADCEVDFLPVQPTLSRGDDLASVVSLLEARVAAERIVPASTTAVLLDELGLSSETADGIATVTR